MLKDNKNLALVHLIPVIFKLTGEHLTDISNASRTLLFNINDFRWDRELLDIFSVPDRILPEVPQLWQRDFCHTDNGTVFRRKYRYVLFLRPAGSTFWQMCFNEGDSKSTFGTGSFLMMNTGGKKIESKNNLLSTIFYQDTSGKVYYALEGSIYNSGSIFQWLKEEMGIIREYGEIEDCVKKTGYQENLFFVPAFTGLGAPCWDPYARGLIIGIERSTGKKEVLKLLLKHRRTAQGIS